jgi:dipeptidase E
MRLILASEGFYTEQIVAKCEQLVGKPRNKINIAVINEAYAMEHEDNLHWVMKNLDDVRNSFGGKLELVNLLALNKAKIRERIAQHDVIFVVGGHVDYLMSVFVKTGFAEMLPELLQNKVYVGSSAGSMVMGKRLSSRIYKEIYGQEGTYGVEEYMGLVDFAILPHLESADFDITEEKVREVTKGLNEKIYAIDDNTAIVIENNKVTTIGNVQVVING